MRFILTLLCMITIATVVAVVAVVDLVLRCLPVLIVVAVVIAAVRISRRRRRPHPRASSLPQTVVNVPDASAFAAIGSRAADGAPTRLRELPPAPRPSASPAAGRYAAPWPVVVDGVVVDEDGHRG